MGAGLTRAAFAAMQRPMVWNRRFQLGVLWACGLAALAVGLWQAVPLARAWLAPARQTPLAHEAYVWQRLWTPQVGQAVKEAAPWLQGLHVLAAEMQVHEGKLRTTQVLPDWKVLAAQGRPVGAAFRVFPSVARDGWDAATLGQMAELIEAVRQEAEEAGVRLAEVHLDYDCPETRLAEYTALLRVLKPRLAPLPVRITTLPAWLKKADFAPLAAEAPGYVLQVHSLHLPGPGRERVTLVDEAETRAAVAAAVALGHPFRVALPTYSCVAEFGKSGRVTEVYSEDLPASYTSGSTDHLALDADAFQMQTLVAEWRKSAPALLEGVVWYRLPVEGDRLNWPLRTLKKICTGAPLNRGWRAEARPNPAGTQDLVLTQEGDAPDDLPRLVEVRWSAAAPLAADGLRGYDAFQAGEGWARFRLLHPYGRLRAPPGAAFTAGWIRLEPADVAVKVVLNPPPRSP